MHNSMQTFPIANLNKTPTTKQLVNVQNITLMTPQINAWSEFIKITLQNCHRLTQFGDTVTPMLRLFYPEE